MTTPPLSRFPASQRAIQARCVHPSGRSADFPLAALDSTLGDRFARQAALHAGRPAIETREHALTYRETHRRAAGVAARLRSALGAGSAPVALLLGRGAPAIWSALGALAAGNGCVPLDPAHPRARERRARREPGEELVPGAAPA